MDQNIIIQGGEFVPHPANEGVFLRHLFTSKQNDRLSNAVVKVEPGYQIAPHTHKVMETMYVISGRGLFLVGEEFVRIDAGNAMLAPKGVVHCIKNDGSDPLVMLCTFSPALI